MFVRVGSVCVVMGVCVMVSVCVLVAVFVRWWIVCV